MSNYVTTAKPKTGGAVNRGPATATLPTSASATLTGFTPLGHISEDGFSNSWEMESEEIKAWGGATVLTYRGEVSDKFSFTLIGSLDPEVLKTVYGQDNVSGSLSTGLSVTVNADEAEEFAWVVDMIMAGDIAKRIVIPRGKVTEVGEIVYKDNEAVGYKVTVTAIQDSAGNTHYEYIQEAA